MSSEKLGDPPIEKAASNELVRFWLVSSGGKCVDSKVPEKFSVELARGILASSPVS